jgi:uncharacterized membrane protein (UPF0127 family)
MTRIRRSLTFLAIAATAGFSWLAAAQNPLPVIELTAGIHRIEAEVAATMDTRMQGLMERKTMSMQHGMLFVFPQVGRHCMWMRNTFLPLSVAFLDERGKIINIEDMRPQTEDNHCAKRDARYALEMNLGWFKTRGLGAEVSIAGIERVPKGR